MKKLLLAGAAVIALAGTSAVFAQHRSWTDRPARMSAEDRAALLDARIAAVRAGLKLTADQDKMWPALESAVRDFAKLRMDRANARMEAHRKADGSGEAQTPANPVQRLQRRADDMAATAAGLKKIADAADPLYQTLDDGQKRRLSVLTHLDRRFDGARRHHRGPPGFEPGGFEGRGFAPPDGRGFRDDDDDDHDRRDHHDRGDRRGSDDDNGPGPERL